MREFLGRLFFVLSIPFRFLSWLALFYGVAFVFLVSPFIWLFTGRWVPGPYIDWCCNFGFYGAWYWKSRPPRYRSYWL